MTGRTLYHFRTRTKTGRAPQLNAAAPEIWVRCRRATRPTGGLPRETSSREHDPRRVRVRRRISGIRSGALFLALYYGYWDTQAGSEPEKRDDGRAANEVTLTDWDPVSKQPIFKTAAAQVRRIAKSKGTCSSAPTTTGSVPVKDEVSPTVGGDTARADEQLGRGTTVEGMAKNWTWRSRNCTVRRATWSRC
ncbi:hypothetical protein [Blastococcus sp. TF02A-26]|uniref:hypothetical protein n=1 Tax=Blastococcus sp. TF02A-26 TaxID=2250577 RepID=UPI0018F5AF75|nr:hypothetical protein [Blastococcus sp. TF02A-26]